MKRLYDMNARELSAEIEAAQSRGDLPKTIECKEQLALLEQVGVAFRRSSEGKDGKHG